MSVGPHQHPDQYELQQRLESDTMSETWKAFDTLRRRYVTIKILHINPQTAADLVPRFQRETRGLASLHHPNIPEVLDVHVPDISSDKPEALSNYEAYLVTEYIEGQSLADYIHTTSYTGKFPTVAEIVSLLTPIGTALDYAHKQGVIHGRVKPGNILFDKHSASESSLGEPKLVGFGMHNMQAPLTLSPEDAYYISPEQIQGYTENIRCDIYSLGVILYELCTGTLPFQGETPAEVMMQHIHAMPGSPALINPHILPALTAVIMRCLAKDPMARFSTASAVVGALTRALNASSGGGMGQSGASWGSVASSGGRQQAVEEMHSPTYPLLRRQLSGAVPAVPAVSNGPVTPSPAIIQQLPSPATTPGNMAAGQSGQMYSVVPGSFARTAPTGQPVPASFQSLPLPVAPSVQPVPPPVRKHRWRWMYSVLIALLIVVVLGAGLGVFFLYPRIISNPQSQLVGHAFFVSSGLVSQNSNVGITDRVQIALQGLPPSQPGKSYYAWLLGDNDSVAASQPILLATLPATTGQITVSYAGDAQHSNLLAKYSRFLITEEDAGSSPLNPSLDAHTWRYFARFSTQMVPMGTGMGPNESHSVLDHLRHLLSQAPELQAAGLTGGLDIWLFRNTLKILEWTGSARDAYKVSDSGLIRRQIVRVLDYLDGEQYIKTENLPPDLPSVLVDPIIARMPLLETDPQNQNPPGYLKTIGDHLRDMAQMPTVTPEQRALAVQINETINNVQSWLTAVHKDAQLLIHMTPAQLQQPSTQQLLDHMFVQANNAFVGQTDPNTNQVKAGVAQIHYDIQRLATFDITPCPSGNTTSSCV